MAGQPIRQSGSESRSFHESSGALSCCLRQMELLHLRSTIRDLVHSDRGAFPAQNPAVCPRTLSTSDVSPDRLLRFTSSECTMWPRSLYESAIRRPKNVTSGSAARACRKSEKIKAMSARTPIRCWMGSGAYGRARGASNILSYRRSNDRPADPIEKRRMGQRSRNALTLSPTPPGHNKHLLRLAYCHNALRYRKRSSPFDCEAVGTP